MAQSFSNPEPADDASFENDNKPILLRVQITDYTVVDTTASRFNVNGTWYSEDPYAIDTWASPDRAGKLLSGLNPGGLRYPVLQDNTEYTWYFEITETGGGGTFTSPEYTFTIGSTAPEKPINPTPANAADDVTLDQATITWEDGGRATSYDVYYGENEEGLTLVSEGQSGTSFTISGIDYGSPFEYVISRTWRIDAVNDAGTTTGDVWTFTTIAFDPPLPTGVTLDAEGEPTGTPSGENVMLTKKRLVAAAENAFYYEDV